MWCDNAAAWADSIMARFPDYVDLLQPVGLALLEVRAGLGLLVAASDAAAPLAAIGVRNVVAASTQQLAEAIQTLIAFPRPLQPPADLGSSSFQQLQASVAAASITGGSADATGGRRSEIAAYTARIEGLRTVLHAAVRWAEVQGPGGSAAESANKLLFAFLRLWEELKAEEERRAEEEASLFKTKTRDNNILSETVTTNLHLQ